MELPARHLLRVHHADDDRVRRLRGAAAGQLAAAVARVRHLRPRLHHVRPRLRRLHPQPPRAQVPHAQHGGREAGRESGH